MNWWQRHKEKRKRDCTAVLAVCRASDMFVAHPDTDYTHVCSRCGEEVGIYPSGQRVLRQHTNVILMCNRCAPQGVGWQLAPGAAIEPSQSLPVRRR